MYKLNISRRIPSLLFNRGILNKDRQKTITKIFNLFNQINLISFTINKKTNFIENKMIKDENQGFKDI